MASLLNLEHSRVFPVPVEHAFDVLLTVPLPNLFRRRYFAIPAIREVRGQDGVWGTVGQSRTIVLADGGTMREELTSLERPHHFGYLIGDITGPMKPLAKSVEGRWSCVADGSGTRVTWQWTVHPRSAVAALAMPVFARLWQGYAARAMEQLDSILRR